MFGMYSESALWRTTRAASRVFYIRDNYFGATTRCSGSECLDGLFFTTPFAASVGYSIGAGLGFLRYRRRETV